MQFYTKALIPAGILGLLMFLRREDSTSVENSAWVPFFSLFMCLWGICFVVLWRRRCLDLTIKWSTAEFEQLEVVRHEFVGEEIVSPVTGDPELVYSPYKRYQAYALSAVVTLMMLSIAFGVMICSLNLQGK